MDGCALLSLGSVWRIDFGICFEAYCRSGSLKFGLFVRGKRHETNRQTSRMRRKGGRATSDMCKKDDLIRVAVGGGWNEQRD